MRQGWSAIVACGLVLTGLLGFGCNRQPEADLIFLATADHNDLDPQKISWLHDGRVAEQLYEPLVVHDFASHAILPGVAERWEVSDDGLTYTFHLRESARWSNGDMVTADDFVYAWRRALLPDMAAYYSRMLYRIEGGEPFFHWRAQQIEQYAQVRAEAGSRGRAEVAEQVWQLTEDRFDETVGITAADDRTLVVRLERPVPYFLDLVAFVTFYPVHRASVEEATRLNAETGMLQVDGTYWSDANRLVTNGPYRLAGHRRGRYLHMEANPHYWDAGSVRNGSILERIVSDQQSAITAYRRGQAHLWPGMPGGPMAADLVADDRRNDVHTQNSAGTYFYNFNCRPELPGGRENPLVDPRVRRALAKAIDRDTIVQRVTRLNQPTALSYIPPGAMPDYDPPTDRGVSYDPERARELLAEAGYPGGEGLTGLSILYNTESAEHAPIAQVIRRTWQQELGVTVDLEPHDLGAYRERVNNGDYTIARAAWFGDYPDPTSWLDRMITDDGNNTTRWSNGEFDALLTDAAEQTNPAERRAMLREAEGILLDEQPMAMIFHYVSVSLWDPDRVEGVEPNAWARWSLKDVRVRQ